MRGIARLGLRHPRTLLLLWAIVFAAGVIFAGHARENVHVTNLRIGGTESQRAAELTERQFGGTVSMAVLLKGPRKAVDRQGPAIVRRLQRIDRVDVLSPWAKGGERVLREPAGQALLALQVRRPFEEISEETTPAVERALREAVHAPLSWEISGQAPLVRAINDATLHSLDEGELRALPVLFVLLLLIFRSPFAALLPAVCGLLVTRVGTAALGLVNETIEIDAYALNIVTMIGLALGVDYSLLIVSRFREELAAGASVGEAVETAVTRAGRTVLFAGTVLVAAMLAALPIAPGALLVSATMGVIVATILAVLAALFLLPSLLALLGTNVNRWRLSFGGGENPWVRIAQRALRKPGVAAFFTLLPLLVLSAPAAALDTGPPNVANLPPDNATRKSYEAFERDRGAGWSTPFEITFHTRGSITTTKRLRALKRFQERVARERGVEAVLGPAVLLQRTAVLRRLTGQVSSGDRQLGRMERGLRRLETGTASLRDGLGAAVGGANALVDGLGQAASGSDLLAGSVNGAAPRTKLLANGVKETSAGAHQLALALKRVEAGTLRIQRNVDALTRILQADNASAEAKLTGPLGRGNSKVQSALRHLGSVSPDAAADPNVVLAKQEIADALGELAPLQGSLAGLATDLDTLATASKEISRAIERLQGGLAKVTQGSGKLDKGVAQTAVGAAQLANAFPGLQGGTASLDAGLSALLGGPDGGSGARALASGLEQAFNGSNQLGRGTQTALSNVVRVRRSNRKQVSALEKSGSDIERASASGYFVLAGIEGSGSQTQKNVTFALNTPGGGDTARVIVVPRTGAFDPVTAALRPALERDTRRAAKSLGGTGVVGGPAVLLDDFQEQTSERLPWLVLALAGVTFIVLFLLFRSPVLALIAVLLNLVTVGAAVGILVVCFQGDPPLLGGPGYLDAIALLGTFAIVFGLSIDYQVFMISRLLEGRALHGTTDGAIRHALERTATVITGAALIMSGVFIAFAISPVATTRQFGVGLTVAVLLDATVVRLVLMPALIKLFGERTWAVPGWVGRVLPGASSY